MEDQLIPVVDIAACTVCGGCIGLCPEVFRINDLGYVEVVECVTYPKACVDEAIKYCPENCIAWERS